MEEMLGEVEQMERVNLLTNKEVKELIKKRKHHEYKIQKRTKQKTDFLSYIQYETNLLNLLSMRRENIGYQHKKAEIEGAIRTRINKLFKILEHRFQSDVSVWLSHIQFLQQVNWESSVSRVYLRMLQVHSDKPGLWVSAAKWEFEKVNNPDNGRQIMLRGLRFLPKSWTLHREYLKFELLYVEQLRKRSVVLGDSQDKKEDTVMDCGIVRLVIQSAVGEINCPEFIISLIDTVGKFTFAVGIVDELLEQLREKFPTSHVTWDTIARMELMVEGTLSMKEKVSNCYTTYCEGLGKTSEPKELFDLAFTTFQELSETHLTCPVKVISCIVKLLETGYKDDLLGVNHFRVWLSVLDIESDKKQIMELVQKGVEKYGNSVDLWMEHLAIHLKTAGKKGAIGSFSKGLAALAKNKEAGKDLVRLWEAMLSTQDPESGWELLQGDKLDRNRPELRLVHLEQAGHRGITVAREIYQTYSSFPPFSKELHWMMFQLEQEQEKVNTSYVRAILTTLCDQFGKSNLTCWLALAKLETESGNPLDAAKIICRAEGTLDKDLVPNFTVIRDKQLL